jgi:hypothetical protein
MDPASQTAPASYEVIIEINLNNPDGRVVALAKIKGLLESILGDDAAKCLARNRGDSTHPYVFARLRAVQILDLVKQDGDTAVARDKKRIEDEPNGPDSSAHYGIGAHSQGERRA